MTNSGDHRPRRRHLRHEIRRRLDSTAPPESRQRRQHAGPVRPEAAGIRNQQGGTSSSSALARRASLPATNRTCGQPQQLRAQLQHDRRHRDRRRRRLGRRQRPARPLRPLDRESRQPEHLRTRDVQQFAARSRAMPTRARSSCSGISSRATRTDLLNSTERQRSTPIRTKIAIRGTDGDELIINAGPDPGRRRAARWRRPLLPPRRRDQLTGNADRRQRSGRGDPRRDERQPRHLRRRPAPGLRDPPHHTRRRRSTTTDDRNLDPHEHERLHGPRRDPGLRDSSMSRPRSPWAATSSVADAGHDPRHPRQHDASRSRSQGSVDPRRHARRRCRATT